MNRIVLARHASTEWTGARYQGRGDLPLTPSGHHEARVLARRTAAEVAPRSPIYVSPARRALETAQVMAAAMDGTLCVDERLREVDCGAAEGLTFDELAARWPNLAERLAGGDPRIDWPDGEPWSSLLARAGRFWCEISSAVPVEAIVVTHGMLSCALLDVAVGGGPVVLGPATAITLARGSDRWTFGRQLGVGVS